MIGFDVRVDGLPQVQAALAMVQRTIEQPAEGLTEAMHAAAREWHANFVSEGGAYKSWKPLAAQTVAERERLGYGGEHPMLQRTGSLMSAAIEFFMHSDSGSHFEEGAAGLIHHNGNSITMMASGYKVQNHSGGPRLPARPIWYSEGGPTNLARDAFAKWIGGKLP